MIYGVLAYARKYTVSAQFKCVLCGIVNNNNNHPSASLRESNKLFGIEKTRIAIHYMNYMKNKR